jgi:hypothetical protein
MIREKLFHLGEDSTIMNESGQPIMQIDGKVLACLTEAYGVDIAPSRMISSSLHACSRSTWPKTGNASMT